MRLNDNLHPLLRIAEATARAAGECLAVCSTTPPDKLPKEVVESCCSQVEQLIETAAAIKRLVSDKPGIVVANGDVNGIAGRIGKILNGDGKAG